MTARIGTTSIDGTPISGADIARIEAEERLHAEQQRAAVRIVADRAQDAADCRTLLAILGLGDDVVAAARNDMASRPAKRSRRRGAAA